MAADRGERKNQLYTIFYNYIHLKIRPMYLTIISLIFGLIIGAFLQFDIPPEYSRYTALEHQP
jgi:hypothetical protein